MTGNYIPLRWENGRESHERPDTSGRSLEQSQPMTWPVVAQSVGKLYTSSIGQRED